MINVSLQRGITLYESNFANGVLSKTWVCGMLCELYWHLVVWMQHHQTFSAITINPLHENHLLLGYWYEGSLHLTVSGHGLNIFQKYCSLCNSTSSISWFFLKSLSLILWVPLYTVKKQQNDESSLWYMFLSPQLCLCSNKISEIFATCNLFDLFQTLFLPHSFSCVCCHSQQLLLQVGFAFNQVVQVLCILIVYFKQVQLQSACWDPTKKLQNVWLIQFRCGISTCWLTENDFYYCFSQVFIPCSSL